MNRNVTLVLVDQAGSVLGALPSFEVGLPWWQEASDVVEAARLKHGVTVTVLRLLAADRPAPPGGEVVYLAQAHGDIGVSLEPFESVTAVGPADLAPEPLRAPWAVPGGPDASVAWALEALGPGDTVAVQQRTWNLSSLWRIDMAGRPVAWLKQVPWFFAHEPAVLRLLDGVAHGLVPEVLAVGEAGRSVLAHVPGEDRYDSGAELCATVAREFHPVQVEFAGRTGDLLAAGVPDRRREGDRFARVAEPWLDSIDGLTDLVDELPARLAAIEACGVPDTLVHGDLHGGNVRATATSRVIVDWGDSVVGHPAFDILRLTDGLPEQPRLLAEWAARWRESVPGCDPGTALALYRPVAALRSATIYQDFLDHIEPSERPYHESDVPDRLRAAVAAVRT
ncbi:phosphotransferase family protein [Symbioplanes lichenis]|uniref:phosphotransferase family protein n=1 Tax=Symbioplanes lichenis TaxID=1629072 RepID=UPI00273867E6|nr:aminoglycoside phosphotransferase family protein [Actinoplanes lichenis]